MKTFEAWRELMEPFIREECGGRIAPESDLWHEAVRAALRSGANGQEAVARADEVIFEGYLRARYAADARREREAAQRKLSAKWAAEPTCNASRFLLPGRCCRPPGHTGDHRF